MQDQYLPSGTGDDSLDTPVDLNAAQPVQHFAFGGIANPAQNPFLRGSDRQFLEARQAEFDAFEQQRQAYNDALTKWQNEVYNPYKTQVDAYNTAAQKYNTEVYDPYKAQVEAYNTALGKYNEEVYNPYVQQYGAYEKAVNDWNAGSRESDYAGPAAPTLARNFELTMPTAPGAFEMTAPTAPEDFKGTAPVLPFKEEDVIKYQQQAASRAQKDAANRATALEVVSNPEQFNFGSMSVANRFMAKGGPVEKSAREMMNEVEAPEDDAAFARMLSEVEAGSKMDREAIRAAVEKVAAAGRGGDELLAYLSPESMIALRRMGGAGTINPATGLPEFKGGVIGRVSRGIRGLFGRSSRPQAAEQPTAAQPAATSAANMKLFDARYLDERGRLTAQEDILKDQINNPSGYGLAAGDLRALEERLAVNQQQRTNLDADIQARAARAAQLAQEAQAKSALPLSQAATDMATLGPSPAKPVQLSDAITQLKQGNRDTAVGMLREIVGLPSLAPAQQSPTNDPMSASFVGPRSPSEQQRFDAINPRSPLVRPPSGNVPLLGAAAGTQTPFAPIPGQGLIQRPTSAGFSPMDPNFLRNISRYDPATQRQMVEERKRDMGLRPRAPVDPNLPDVSGTFVDMGRVPQPDYSQRGVGSVGSIGGISIRGPATPGAMPDFGSPRTPAQQASSPSNYFGLNQPAAPGMSPGTVSTPYNPLAMYQGPSPVQAIANNPNLSPGMLGGQQNAGMMTDRLGNRIYAPGTPFFGFAKGGEADINAMRALVDASNMGEEEEQDPINTDPVGSAKTMLSDLMAQEKPRAKVTGKVGRMPATGGGAETPKEMALQFEALMSQKDIKPKAAKSAQAELRALAKSYQLKKAAAENAARGLMSNTLGAPTLEKPTLEQGTLTTRRFAEGGEAKKGNAAEVKEPSLFGVSNYATEASARMFPDQLGQDDQRDAARHMLAAATVARKYGPRAADMLGKAHEYTSNPRTFFSLFGIDKPREDFPYDMHNNRVGMELGARATSQADLERLVQQMARQASFKQTPGRPWIMSPEQMEARKQEFLRQQREMEAQNTVDGYKHGGTVKHAA